jgi:hypothetical protein
MDMDALASAIAVAIIVCFIGSSLGSRKGNGGMDDWPPLRRVNQAQQGEALLYASYAAFKVRLEHRPLSQLL